MNVRTTLLQKIVPFATRNWQESKIEAIVKKLTTRVPEKSSNNLPFT